MPKPELIHSGAGTEFHQRSAPAHRGLKNMAVDLQQSARGPYTDERRTVWRDVEAPGARPGSVAITSMEWPPLLGATGNITMRSGSLPHYRHRTAGFFFPPRTNGNWGSRVASEGLQLLSFDAGESLDFDRGNPHKTIIMPVDRSTRVVSNTPTPATVPFRPGSVEGTRSGQRGIKISGHETPLHRTAPP